MDTPIVASLDVVDRDILLSLAELIESKVFAIKINWPTILALGKSIIRELGKISNVICDLKIADIPNTNRLIMEQIKSEKPFAVITHLFTGYDSLESLIHYAGEIKIIGVSSMSNNGAREYLNRNASEMVELARKGKCYGIVTPGNDYTILQTISKQKGDMKIFSPGVGAQGGEFKQAIKSGADYVIIGRAIYESPDPLEYIENLLRK
jgi:orotidine-5'-phosphate decarboxylase